MADSRLLDLDDAVLAIQEAANKIVSAIDQSDGRAREDKQDKILSSLDTLTERVASLEQTKGKKKKKDRTVPLYDRVSLC